MLSFRPKRPVHVDLRARLVQIDSDLHWTGRSGGIHSISIIAVRPSISTIRCFLLYPCVTSTLPFAMQSSHDRKSPEAGALLLAHPSTGLQPLSGLNYLVAIICSLFSVPKKVISGKIRSLQPLSQNTRVGVGLQRTSLLLAGRDGSLLRQANSMKIRLEAGCVPLRICGRRFASKF